MRLVLAVSAFLIVSHAAGATDAVFPSSAGDLKVQTVASGLCILGRSRSCLTAACWWPSALDVYVSSQPTAGCRRRSGTCRRFTQ